jgi:hypothetical protein
VGEILTKWRPLDIPGENAAAGLLTVVNDRNGCKRDAAPVSGRREARRHRGVIHAARSQGTADLNLTQRLAERSIARGRGFAATG